MDQILEAEVKLQKGWNRPSTICVVGCCCLHEIWLWEIEDFSYRYFWLYGTYCMRHIYRGTMLVCFLFIINTSCWFDC
jgi:hypothetical protein